MSAVLSFPSPVPDQASPLRVVANTPTLSDDVVTIRGVRLPLAELVDRSLFAPERRERLRQQLQEGSPFPHLVLNNIFHPSLLLLVAEEFDMASSDVWASVNTKYESTRRSVSGAKFGPATQLYFDTIHSSWFMEWLSSVTGVPYLLSDPKMWGGGMHESLQGAKFAVHRDFNRHRDIGLKNEMVFITYLNKSWDPEWGSALELWDKKKNECVTMVQPEFGRSILLPHGPNSYHGHTKPLKTPDGRSRRSVAAYFYTSPLAGKRNGDESASVFMQAYKMDKLKTFARMMTPPVVWSMARKITGH